MDRQKLCELLNAYGSEEHEPSRVRLAVLKLGDSELLTVEKWTECVKSDFRDVFAGLNTRQSKVWAMSEGLERQKLIDADKREYEQWLRGELEVVNVGEHS